MNASLHNVESVLSRRTEAAVQPVFTLPAGLGMVMGFRVGGVDLRRGDYDLFRIA